MNEQYENPYRNGNQIKGLLSHLVALDKTVSELGKSVEIAGSKSAVEHISESIKRLVGSIIGTPPVVEGAAVESVLSRDEIRGFAAELLSRDYPEIRALGDSIPVPNGVSLGALQSAVSRYLLSIVEATPAKTNAPQTIIRTPETAFVAPKKVETTNEVLRAFFEKFDELRPQDRTLNGRVVSGVDIFGAMSKSHLALLTQIIADNYGDITPYFISDEGNLVVGQASPEVLATSANSNFESTKVSTQGWYWVNGADQGFTPKTMDKVPNGARIVATRRLLTDLEYPRVNHDGRFENQYFSWVINNDSQSPLQILMSWDKRYSCMVETALTPDYAFPSTQRGARYMIEIPLK